MNYSIIMRITATESDLQSMISTELLKQAISLIKQSKNVLILPSSPADGDSLGSGVALHLALKKLGKESTVVCADPVPEVLEFLPHTGIIKNEFYFARDLVITLSARDLEIEHITHDVSPDKVNIIVTPINGKIDLSSVRASYGKSKYDLVVAVDAGDVSQFEGIYENNTELFSTVPVINIDHHISNTEFGKINLVDVMASSASSIVMFVIKEMGDNLIDADIATLLLAGLITDTSSFQNPNTTPDAFAIAAELIELGARQQEIIQRVYKTKKMSTLKLWGRVLSKIQYDETHRLAWSTITKHDLDETNSAVEEADGVIDELMTNAPGCEIALLLKEKGDGIVSGSLRTTTASVDASKLAAHFGGGGHVQASGFKISGRDIGDVERETVSYLKDFQSNRLALPKQVDDKPAVGETSPEAVAVSVPFEFPTPLDMREQPKSGTTEPIEATRFNPIATPDELV